MLSVPGLSGPAWCPLLRHATILSILLALAAFGPAGAAAPPEPAQPTEPPPRFVQSAEDRGFAIVLTSPTEPWVNGRRTIRIEAIIPRDDTVEQVDFFVDRKLAFVDNDEPYVHTFDFGAEIRRHTIEVKALTKEGRRARVSLVTRSVDLTESARGRIVTFTAMVRDAAGRPVDRLNVSDFSVTEAGTPQPIVHFLQGPNPGSMAVVVDPSVWDETRAGLEHFLAALPPPQAVALFGPPGAATFPAAAPDQPEPAPTPDAKAPPAAAHARSSPGTDVPAVRAATPFTYDLAALAASMPRGPAAEEKAEKEDATQENPEARPASGAPRSADRSDLLRQAAAALGARRGPRLLLVVVAAAPLGDEPFGPQWPPPETTKPPAAGKEAAVPAHPAQPEVAEAPDPLAAALDEARRSGAAVHVIALPAPPGVPWHVAQETQRTWLAAVEASGGHYSEAPDTASLESALATVSQTLRHQYVVTYAGEAPAQGGWKPLKVEAAGRDLIVEAPRSVYLGD